MLKAMKTIKRQSGISLLELMLSLAIIAVILTMATRFYNQASQNQNLNNAVSMVNGVAAAIKTYRLNVSASTPTISIQTLVNANQLPKDFGGADGTGAGANPWGGNLTLTAPAGSAATLSLTSIPDGTGDGTPCKSLAHRLEGVYSTVTCESGTVTVTIDQ